MSEQPAPPVRRRILRNLVLSFCAFSVLAIALIGWWVTTDSFQQRMRRRVIAELEQATGGRVELGELHTIPFRLRVDARNLTIHGREAADQAPFLQVERIQAELKIISLFETSIGLHSLVLERPVFHVIAYPDGTTNIPTPSVKLASNRTAVEHLISLSVARIEAHDGRLLWQNQNVPFEFTGGNLALLLDYSLLRQHYEAHLTAGTVQTKWDGYAEFVWSADASVVLARHHADIKDVTFKSGHSEVHFVGTLENYSDPQIAGQYRGSVDLGELAAVVRGPHLRQGTAQFTGKGSWNLRTFATDGNLEAKGIEWSDGKKLSLRDGRVLAVFALDPVRLRVPALKANLLGGNVAGDLEITNWETLIESLPVIPRRVNSRAAANLPRGSIRLQVAGIPITPALDALSSPRLPLDRLSFVANASGALDLTWVGSIRDSETRMKLDLSAPSRLVAEGIPVTGKVEGIYHASRDELDLTASHVTTSSSEIQAAGSLSENSALHFSISTHNIKEWTPLIEAAYGSPQLPLAVHGFATLAGNASGHLSAISFNGNLELYDFETLLPATRRTPAEAIHWDALSTALQYSSSSISAHNGSLIHGHALAHFDASATLTGGELQENSPFTIHLDLLKGDVAEFARLAGVDRPLAGTLNMTVNLSGSRGNPQGDGHFEVRDGQAYGVAIPSAKGDLRLANDELQFNNIEARAYDALLSASGGISTTTDSFHLSLSGQNLNLLHFPRLQSTRFTMDGVIDFSAIVSGTPQEPSLELHARLKDLALDQQRAGDFFVDAVTTGHQLDIKAHSAFGASGLNIAGTIGLQKDFPADLKLDFHDLDVVSLLSIYLPGDITGRSPMDGTMQLRGPLRFPQQWKAAAELSGFSAEVEKVQVHSVEPVRFQVVDQTLIIEAFHLGGSGTDFTAHGRAHLAGAQEIDLGLDGTINMTLWQSLNPKILARGTLGVNLNASGSFQQPVLQGRLDVKNTF
ncbi:MAG: hypothetical protein WA618_08710, partial [Terriglobales bacterium]